MHIGAAHCVYPAMARGLAPAERHDSGAHERAARLDFGIQLRLSVGLFAHVYRLLARHAVIGLSRMVL